MTGKQFTSVWLHEPRKAATPQGRTRDEIVVAALELLDAEGLAGLSMRKLGAKLMAGATSLYWYVANKDELLELVYDHIWGELVMPDPDAVGWRDAASIMAHSMRQVILSHPWAADLLGRLPALGPRSLSFTDRMSHAFRLAGFTGMDIDFANATLTGYVLGMTIPEVAWNNSMMSQTDQEQLRETVVRIAADYPGLSDRLAGNAEQNPQVVRELCFDFGLVSVLDGLETRLAK